MTQYEDILTKALSSQDYLMHHGILGQKWGVRRYQNPDGSLTEEGKKHYLNGDSKAYKDYVKIRKQYEKTYDEFDRKMKEVKKNIRKNNPTDAEIKEAGIRWMQNNPEYEDEYDHDDPKAVERYYSGRAGRHYLDYGFDYDFPNYTDPDDAWEITEKQNPKLAKQLDQEFNKLTKAERKAFKRSHAKTVMDEDQYKLLLARSTQGS